MTLGEVQGADAHEIARAAMVRGWAGFLHHLLAAIPGSSCFGCCPRPFPSMVRAYVALVSSEWGSPLPREDPR
jgi:hypothetical protein